MHMSKILSGCCLLAGVIVVAAIEIRKSDVVADHEEDAGTVVLHLNIGFTKLCVNNIF